MSLSKLNAVCQTYNRNYKALYVSWNDNSRYVNSCFGKNITDCTITDENNEKYLCIRPDNFNERIGSVKAKDVHLIMGTSQTGRIGTLDEYLKDFYQYSKYRFPNIEPSTSLMGDEDQEISIRFQALFIPEGRNLCTTSFNYQTYSDTDPKNIIILCTSQGTFVNKDKRGTQKQYIHRPGDHVTSRWNNHYMELTSSRFGVCQSQVETLDERQEAIQNNLASSALIGLKSMGEGFNRLMTIQVPIVQTNPKPRFTSDPGDFFTLECCALQSQSAKIMHTPGKPKSAPFRGTTSNGIQLQKCLSRLTPAKSAKVSYGKIQGPLETENSDSLTRDTTEPITITVQYYFTYTDDVDENDIRAAIDICENSLSGCNWNGKLMDQY